MAGVVRPRCWIWRLSGVEGGFSVDEGCGTLAEQNDRYWRGWTVLGTG